jgi:DNA (cytosine-5)-methyltransferase 1
MNEEMHRNLGLLRKSNQAMYKRMPVWSEGKGELPKSDLTALGFTSGIGSMLIGARDAGFSVLGNIEWRDYYRYVDSDGHNTFTENFPGAFFTRGFRDMDPFVEYDLRRRRIDLAMGHPECGKYSLLNSSNKKRLDDKRDAGDIPLFLEYVADLKPRYFVMDDLPQSFIALPMKRYHELLPEYDLFPEWISNYNYGNPQKHRRRMFMIGSLKTENYTFVPGEKDDYSNWTVLERIGDIESMYGLLPNHDPHVTTGRSSRFCNMRHHGDRPNWGEVQTFFKKYQKEGANFRYYGPNGIKVRPSLIRIKYDYPSPVITGGNPHMHPTICLPLTIRERARIQGFPDDFVFYGTKFNEQGEWEHNNHNMIMVKQTGKAMPIEFNRFVANQIATHIRGKKIKASNQRYLKPDFHISKAKTWYCENIGYANQEKACKSCWLYESCDLPRKTGEKVPLDLVSLL